ncbi:MAG: sigma-70 family RNA polymerase sigma factor [Verrucomicrobiales bacterium]|nr:sigma-70 family RNA polymerase sigma factor [Verrucomicrobiales bacterium]
MESNDLADPSEIRERHSEFIRNALERYESPLVRYGYGLTGNLETARDVVQDTFLRLCEQPPGEVDGHLAQWLFTVCRNRALDVHRKATRMTSLAEGELDQRASADPSPAESAVTRDTVHRIDALLEELPVNQREVVRLKFQNQLSYQEIATVTSLSVGNVGFLLHTALKTLRGRLDRLERPSSLRA